MSDLNELVNLKAAEWSHQLTLLKPLRFINKIAVYCLCPFSNFILLHFIVFRSPLVVRRSYRSILITCTLVDITSTLTNIWCLMYGRYIGTRTIYFLEGAVSILPLSLQWISFSLMFGVRLSESTILVVEFYFRHYIIKHRRTPSHVVLFGMIGLAIAVALGLSVTIMFDCCILNPMQSGNFEALKAIHSGPILFDDTNHKIAYFTMWYRRSITIGGVVIPVFISFLSVRLMSNQTVTLSKKTKLMLNNFSATLYMKTIIPALTTVLPLTSKFFFNLFGLDTWSLNEMTTTFYVWLPFINSISTLLIISCYRRLLFQAIRKAFGQRSTSIYSISRLTT
ncbi:hypothetical protein M3Y95_01160500 [Aphelenchoides besseyi]|nr:hypothetical protein M3Y95_01160500 [Aphelenchoides besseyi]